jgi:hypothetical protein
MTLYATGARRAEVARAEGKRHRQPADGGSHPRRQGPQGPGRDAEPGAARSAAHLLAWTSAQADRYGCFRATGGIPQAALSPTKVLWTACQQAAFAPVWSTRTSIRTPCGTASQRICSKLAPTFARSRSCSDIAILKRPRSICTSRSKHLSATSSPLDALALVPQGEAVRSA